MLNQLRAVCVRSGARFFRYPLAVMPSLVKQQLIQQVLCAQFHSALSEGELDFLKDRWLGIEVDDLGLRWAMTVRSGKICVQEQAQTDVLFRASANDFLLIAARRCDPDTLFFQRRLTIEGDTELGLEVKNLMDALELETLPAPLRKGLIALAAFVEAGLNEDANSPVNRAGKLC